MSAAVAQMKLVHVADIMNPDVVTVSANTLMSDALRVLLENQISGAPVVDERGKCVGVLSLADFARRDQSLKGSDNLPPIADEFALRREAGSGTLHIEHEMEGYVRQHMCHAVQSIAADQSLIDAARYMHGEKIHRLIVLDEASCPVGVVGSLDVIGAFVEIGEQ